MKSTRMAITFDSRQITTIARAALGTCTKAAVGMILSAFAASMPSLAQGQATPRPPAAEQAAAYAIGDRLRVTVFEQLDAPQGAGRSRDAMRAFYQRVDLGGEYSIDGDGTVNLPRLGRIRMTGRTAEEIRQEIASALQKDTGRAADIHIAIMERQPVYVVGDVRQPGSFKFAPGMMAIQAIALAGGTEQATQRGLTPVDASRERERAAIARSRLASLLARRAALQSTRYRVPPEAPDELVAIVGAERARELVEAEHAANQRAADQRASEVRRLNAVIAAAREELRAMRLAAEQTRRLASSRQSQVSRVSEPDPRLTNQQLVAGLQAEAADFDLRNRQYEVAASQVEQRIAEATGDLAKIELEFRTRASRDLATAEQEIAALRETLVSAGRIADQIQNRGPEPQAGGLTLRLVRQTNGQARELPAETTTLLLPGDVLQVRAPTGTWQRSAAPRPRM
jgi:protein involved in polysaccharide export with SLBB domain